MWDGTRNWQVRNFMRDEMKVGDKVVFYHSSAGKDTGAVGEMKVVKEAYPDPTQFDKKADHYDAKSTQENPRWLAVDVQFVEKWSQVVTLAEMRSISALKNMRLLERGNRLSVIPLTKKEFEMLCKLGKK